MTSESGARMISRQHDKRIVVTHQCPKLPTPAGVEATTQLRSGVCSIFRERMPASLHNKYVSMSLMCCHRDTRLGPRGLLPTACLEPSCLRCRPSYLVSRNGREDSPGFALVVSPFLTGPLACWESMFAKSQGSFEADSESLSGVRDYSTY